MDLQPHQGLEDDSLLFEQVRDLLDWKCAWYQEWYFLFRLEEELIRCREHGRSCSLVVITLLDPPNGDIERNWLYELLATLTFDGFELTDIPGVLSPTEYAVLLPETGLGGARIVADRIRRRLWEFAPVAGIAVFPDEAATGRGLIETAFTMGWRDTEARMGIHTMPS